MFSLFYARIIIFPEARAHYSSVKGGLTRSRGRGKTQEEEEEEGQAPHTSSLSSAFFVFFYSPLHTFLLQSLPSILVTTATCLDQSSSRRDKGGVRLPFFPRRFFFPHFTALCAVLSSNLSWSYSSSIRLSEYAVGQPVSQEKIEVVSCFLYKIST